MKLQGLILICLLLSLGGCSGGSDAAPEASPTPEASQQANADGAPAKKKAAPKAKAGAKNGAPTQTADLSGSKDFKEAEKAYAEGRFRDAALITRNSLDVLKSDEAPRAEIVKRTEYLANCQAKAGMYDKACANYAVLVKAEPANKEYAAALKSTKSTYWEKVLGPQLTEAERLRDNKRYSSARSMADEVKMAAAKVNLSTEQVDKVLASIDKAQGQVAQSRAQNQEVAVAAPPVQAKTNKKPKKAPPRKASTGTEEPESYPSYPTSGGSKKGTSKRKG